jgi:hypothetical protein
MQFKRVIASVTAGAILSTLAVGVVAADAPANDYFERTWERTDRPVATGAVQRTWLWGPEAFTGERFEYYAEAHNNGRAVQYFDKARMEINHDIRVPADSPWYVTNGLLVTELATGRLQLGDSTFQQRQPSDERVAGDPDADSPTYATIGALMASPARQLGTVITERLAPDTTVVDDPSLAGLDVTAYYYVPETKHTVAEPFWYFITSTQPVYEDGKVVMDDLFESPFYATGLPISEAYWVHTTLHGHETDILVQAFERRVLTYTPTNPAGWQVESGNVGRHYYAWRYGGAPNQPGQHVVVTSFDTGPETIEYRHGGQLPGQDVGPSALSVAPDGSFWLADVPGGRLARFDQDGTRTGVIDLDDRAQSIFDVDARTDTIWVSWANIGLGVSKLQAFTPGGALLHDFDLPQSIWGDPAYVTNGIAVNNDGEVIMDLDNGQRYLRVATADGQPDASPLDGWAFDGHSFRMERVDGAPAEVTVVVDGRAFPIVAEPDPAGREAVGLQVDLLPEPDGYGLFNTRYSVYDAGSTLAFRYTVERRGNDGTLFDHATVPLDERYADVRYPYAIGPEGNVYMLMTYADHLEVLRLVFRTP